ncbi:MAG: glutamate synthase large subunit [bacterium]
MNLANITDDFHFDSCGFGLIANLEGIFSHEILAKSLTGLARLSHRGTKAKDGKSADGCGVLFNIDKDFFIKLIKQESSIDIDFEAIAVVFLNQETKLNDFQKAFTDELEKKNFKLIYTRAVPHDASVLGQRALETLPQIYQFFINAERDVIEHETSKNTDIEIYRQSLNGTAHKRTSSKLRRKLYIAKRLTESKISCHFASLSTKMISYKGMLTPENLGKFYPDLKQPELTTSNCLFHQRFSTNTFPEWHLVQPFNHLAHNGEINTIEGNRNWAQAKRKMYYSEPLRELQSLKSLIHMQGSDSKSMDSMLELLLAGGFDLLTSTKILVPPAYEENPKLDKKLRSMYEYFSLFIEPWDGPSAIASIDEEYAICNIDRNGLRPARYVLTNKDEFCIASELGVVDYKADEIILKGKLGAGESIAIDLKKGLILFDKDISDLISSKYDYIDLIESSRETVNQDFSLVKEEINFDEKLLKIYYKYKQISLEELNIVYTALSNNAQEALSSMGDDSCLAVLSKHKRNLFDYFRQRFAQVTNPPIDSIREKNVMCLNTYIGAIGNIFEDFAEGQKRIKLLSPVLSQINYIEILSNYDQNSIQEIDLNIPFTKDIKTALLEIKENILSNLSKNKNLIILSDKDIKENHYQLHPLMATAFINYFLIREELRAKVNIIVITGEAKDPHHFACLIAFGATLVYPYLSYQVINQIHFDKSLDEKEQVCRNYQTGIENGILKILSKMGISTINSYRGSGLFDILGLDQDFLNFCFNGKQTVIGGLSISDYEEELKELAKEAWDESKEINCGGIIKYLPNAEEHGFTPPSILKLQEAVKNDDYEAYKEFSSLITNREYLCIRDLFDIKSDREPISIEDVESRESIIKRFSISAMSLGAISPEAHSALAEAMNILGARSNSGEGGEDIKRIETNSHSKIKQIASGRFGVTAEYLINAEVIQIKIAQGAKPGEGGQLPGFKVNAMIAKLRHSKEGTTLISPPPHHDIYSIEDLAQLIYDLKEINPSAEISVKLVSSLGVATVALGACKANADAITIAGADGGTGASPLSSIRYAGFPWEIGLLLTHKLLLENNYRDDISLQVDGGLKNGLDIIKAALMGANIFGFGTSALITLGCKYLRICHLNNCATGVATQNEVLRKEHFRGLSDYVISYMNFIAEEIREYLAYLGYQNLSELIGRQDLLERKTSKTSKQANLNFSQLFINLNSVTSDLGNPSQKGIGVSRNAHQTENNFVYRESEKKHIHENNGNHLSKELTDDYKTNQLKDIYKISNADRSIGTALSAFIIENESISDEIKVLKKSELQTQINLKGVAGQSFGAFLIERLMLNLEGAANDYVGKGLSGGTIIIKTPEDRAFIARNSVVMGNTCLYGATSGKLFAEGLAGERFGIRNSGATAVIEGAGDYACEYMTGGTVVILGSCGIEIGAGMTGGKTFIFDPEFKLANRINAKSVKFTYLKDLNETIKSENSGVKALELSDEISNHLKSLIEEHAKLTNSSWAKHIISHYNELKDSFALVYCLDSKIEELFTDGQLPLSKLH